MEVETLRIEIENRLPKKRYEHVLRVADTAKKLASQYGVPMEKAEQAALFHDIAKYMEPVEMRRIIEQGGEDDDSLLFDYHHELWHAAAGRVIARDEFGVKDQDILNAIRYHTTGRAGMSTLEKVIYVADLIEPGRNFPGIDDLRDTEGKTIDVMMQDCLIHSVLYLIGKRVAVYPDSIDCYNGYVQRN